MSEFDQVRAVSILSVSRDHKGHRGHSAAVVHTSMTTIAANMQREYDLTETV